MAVQVKDVAVAALPKSKALDKHLSAFTVANGTMSPLLAFATLLIHEPVAGLLPEHDVALAAKVRDIRTATWIKKNPLKPASDCPDYFRRADKTYIKYCLLASIAGARKQFDYACTLTGDYGHVAATCGWLLAERETHPKKAWPSNAEIKDKVSELIGIKNGDTGEDAPGDKPNAARYIKRIRDGAEKMAKHYPDIIGDYANQIAAMVAAMETANVAAVAKAKVDKVMGAATKTKTK